MGDAEIDQPRFLASCDDLDRMPQRRFGPGDEFVSVLGNAQGRGADAAHRFRRQSAQAFAEALQAGQRAFLGVLVEPLALAEPAGQAHRLLQRIERIQLVAGHARHFQAERVGAEIDGGKRVMGLHAVLPKNRYAMPMAARMPATSAISPQATAWRTRRTPTAPKYTAST